MRTIAAATGIYVLINILSSKRYFGSAKNCRERVTKHLRWLREGTHWNKHLQAAYNLGQRFRVELVEECNVEVLIKREDYYIETFKTRDKRYGYNKVKANRTELDEETHERMSKARKGKSWEEFYGEERAKKRREEFREQFSGQGNPMFGRRGDTHSFTGKTTVELFGEETANKMKLATSKAHKGKVLSEETRQKIAAAKRGRKLSEECKKKIAKGTRRYREKTGRKTFEEVHGDRVEEVKARLSEATKRQMTGKSWVDLMGAERAEARKAKMRKPDKKCRDCSNIIRYSRTVCDDCLLIIRVENGRRR